MFSISRGKSPQIVKSSCLSLLLFSSFIASTPVFAVDAVTQPVSFSCANFLHHTGLQDVLEQIPRWIDAEIAASNGFLAGKPELAAQIKQRLMQQFVDQGQHALCAKAAEAVGEANVELAGSRLAVPVFEQLSGLRSTA
ncbi:MAG TPA: hypothetical protein VFM46_00340, partial [Pseudomonadales bacterium]|nr:hypothetical protein [Pseudomonadales bacterium]